MRVVRAILWPGLPLWFLARVVRVEREAAADFSAVAASRRDDIKGAAAEYAALLVEVARLSGDRRAGRGKYHRAATAAGERVDLESRVRRLLTFSSRTTRARLLLAALALTAAAWAAISPPVEARPVSAARDSKINEAAAAVEEEASLAGQESGVRAAASARAAASQNVFPATADQNLLTTPGERLIRNEPVREAADSTTEQPDVVREDDQNVVRRVGAKGSDKRYFQLSLYRLEGLSQVLPIRDGSKLEFRVTRDAGTFLFQGVFRGGDGAGTYRFAYDPGFVARMREFGYADISPEDQFVMAVHDIGVTLARDLRELKGRSVPLDELIQTGRGGVNSDYVRGLRDSGVEPASEQQLAEMRRHGVSESFIRELAARGYERPTADELINARKMGVTIAFIQELGAMGYKRPPLGKLADMRMQGITIDHIRELEAMGYGRPTIDQLLGMKLFGVTPGFIRAVEAIGYRGLSPDLLGCLRIHGITSDYLKQATDGGRKRVSLRELVRLKNPNGRSQGSCELQVFPDRVPDQGRPLANP